MCSRIKLILFLLVIISINTSGQSCYEITLQAGENHYQQGNYAEAIKTWQRAKSCSDAKDQSTRIKELNVRIWKAKDDDGDKIVNGKDVCPQVAASTKNGCPPVPAPDTDRDLIRREQKQIEKLLPPPDTDQDGTPDQNDQCPRQKGPASNSGCPLLPPIPTGMVFVKGGTFEMGDVMGDKEYTNETVHTVTVNDFLLAKNELTFAEYDAFCKSTGGELPADEGWGRGNRPVINVDWYDAIEYCNWRSTQEGLQAAYTINKTSKDANNSNSSDNKKWTISLNRRANGYRLPTEAEWEYAAREGGKKVRFGNGKDIADPREINFDGSSSYKKSYSITGVYQQKTLPAGSLNSSNQLGLHDMSGNVWEWCQDWYDSDFYAKSPANNPVGSTSGSSRVCRGGSWYVGPAYLRVANRDVVTPSSRFNVIGFRLARQQ